MEQNTDMVILPPQYVRETFGSLHKYCEIQKMCFFSYLKLDVASGSSIDWVYEKVKVPLTYTYEFRDKGRYGFILPADQIIPNSLEVIDSLVAMVASANGLGYL